MLLTFFPGRGTISKGRADRGGHQTEHPRHGRRRWKEKEEENCQKEKEGGGEERSQKAGNYNLASKHGKRNLRDFFGFVATLKKSFF